MNGRERGIIVHHIAKFCHNETRRRLAKFFVDLIKKAYSGTAPWSPIAFPTLEIMVGWLDQFPDLADQTIGLGDASIIQDWKKQCLHHPTTRVRIWSLDRDLAGYDRIPSGSTKG
ncbi:MAG: hypothetical protein HQL97_09515 [Magnetococcales bacterium]|nr:hypothetical protein [Magnetococcales bacterium]